MEHILSRSFFDSDNGMTNQISQLTSEGKTVFVSRGVWKLRKNDQETIEFQAFFRADSDNGRPIIDGGFYATSDPDEIALIKKNRDVSAKIYEPAAPKVEVVEDPAIAPVEMKVKGK